MTGASLSIDVKYDDRKLKAALQRLHRAGGDLHGAFSEIGEYLLKSTKNRFEQQQGPDGEAWQENTPTTKSRKKKDNILIESGNLMDQLHYNAGADGLEFGSNSVYAAMQQFGGTTSPASAFPNKEIPARPFLGISSDDEREILNIVEDHILRGMQKTDLD